MTTWFKTPQNTYINKICTYIQLGHGDNETLNHLLEVELKNTFPTSFKIENPTKELYTQFPYLRHQNQMDLWSLSWSCLNLPALNWLLTHDHPLSVSKFADLQDFITRKNEKLQLLLEDPTFPHFLVTFAKKYEVKFKTRVSSPKGEIHFIYALLPHLPTHVAKEVIKECAPTKFSDLRILAPELVEWTMKCHGTLFPLINNICVYEKKRLKLSPNLSEGDLKEIDTLVTYNKLSEGLTQVFGLSSNLFLKAFEPTFCHRTDQIVTLDIPFFKRVSFLAKIFLPHNSSDFLNLLSKDLSPIKSGYENFDRCKNFANLINIFQDPQKVELLENVNRRANLDSLTDMIDLFASNPAYYNKFLKSLDFKECNRIHKLRDFIFEQADKAEVEYIEMDPTEFFPQAKQLQDIIFPDGSKFVIPTSNHELIDWGTTLDNCIGDYQEDTANGEVLILGLFNKNNKLKYAIEVTTNQDIEQIEGKSRSKPDSFTYSCIVKALESVKLITR